MRRAPCYSSVHVKTTSFQSAPFKCSTHLLKAICRPCCRSEGSVSRFISSLCAFCRSWISAKAVIHGQTQDTIRKHNNIDSNQTLYCSFYHLPPPSLKRAQRDGDAVETEMEEFCRPCTLYSKESYKKMPRKDNV